MIIQPTYTAGEILEMSKRMDAEAFRVIAELIEDEIDLYTKEDLVILVQSSMIMFTRGLLSVHLKGKE
jgi:hypothetical protein